nr:hypothetical protein 20 [bacterium]
MKKIDVTDFKQPHNTVNAKGFYVLTRSYEMRLILNKVKKVFLVPKGFTYDGASIPRFAWSLLGLYPDGNLRGAATFHDWLYRSGGKILDISNTPYFFNRKEADTILNLCMQKSGIGFLRRRVVFTAVRIFGKRNWSK